MAVSHSSTVANYDVLRLLRAGEDNLKEIVKQSKMNGASKQKDLMADVSAVDPDAPGPGASAPGPDTQSTEPGVGEDAAKHGPEKKETSSLNASPQTESQVNAHSKEAPPNDAFNASALLLSRSDNMCIRHQRMADEGATARLQKVSCKRSHLPRGSPQQSLRQCSMQRHMECWPWQERLRPDSDAIFAISPSGVRAV